MAILLLLLTKAPLVHRFEHEHPNLGCLALWVLGMLSYRQDARHRGPWWAILSQTLAVVSLIALVVFGFTANSWPNFLIAPPLLWLQIQFTKRWWSRPGAWW